MPMSIYLIAKLSGTFTPDDSSLAPYRITKEEDFDCWQTPTEVTKKILNAQEDNKKEIYVKYIQQFIGPMSTAEYHLKQLDRFMKKYSHYKMHWYEL